MCRKVYGASARDPWTSIQPMTPIRYQVNDIVHALIIPWQHFLSILRIFELATHLLMSATTDATYSEYVIMMNMFTNSRSRAYRIWDDYDLRK